MPLSPPLSGLQAGLVAVVAGLLGVYALALAAPLSALAAADRSRYLDRHGPAAEAASRSSFRRNLKRRGSTGHHLEFLGFEVETRKELVLTTDGGGGGAGGGGGGGAAGAGGLGGGGGPLG